MTLKCAIAQAVIEALYAAGGELLLASLAAVPHEGTLGHNWTVVIRFPPEGATNAYYASEAYAEFKPIRHDATDMDASAIFMIPGYKQ